MLPVTLIIILTAILVVLVILSYYLPSDHDIQSNEQLGKEYGQTKNYVYTTIVLVSVALVAGIYIWLKDTIWAGHVMEWLNIVIRLMHITFGIACCNPPPITNVLRMKRIVTFSAHVPRFIVLVRHIHIPIHRLFI